MSHAITFDTLAFAKKLEISGIEPKHAEAVVEAIRDIFDGSLGTTVFTKDDGKLLKSELKTELIMWIVGSLFAQTAIIISIMKFIH